jgi:predicted ATPase
LAGLLDLPQVASPQAATTPVKKSIFAALSDKMPAEPPPATGLNALLQKRLADAAPPAPSSMWQQLADRVSAPKIIVNLLARLAQRGPLLVILEDVHWLDNESATLINDLLAHLAGLPLLLALTSRSPAEESRHLRLPAREVLQSGLVNTLPLPPLPDAALAQVACHALGGQSLDDTLAVWLCRQAAGNPLYAETLCQALIQADAVLLDRQTGQVRWTSLAPALPLSLHELLLARFEELPLAEQNALKRAAVIGVNFDQNSLELLCRDRLGQVEIQSALERTAQAGFISQLSDTTYYFNHALMHETIYETLSFAQRQTWHTQVGDRLAAQQPEALELIAAHYLRGNDPAKAADFACRAGDKARELGVYAGALEYYEQVLALSNAPADLLARAAAGRDQALALTGGST